MNEIEYWNEYPKPSEEVDVVAEENDLVVEIGGILYLLQRKNEFNNVICFRTKKTGVTTLQSFLEYRKWLIGKGVQYIRVEGNTRRYLFLTKLHPSETTNVIQDTTIPDRNVFYIKLV